jgi:hypothetical protein
MPRISYSVNPASRVALAITGDFIHAGFEVEDPCFLMSRTAPGEGKGEITGEGLPFFLKDGNLFCAVFMVISFGKAYRALHASVILHHE